jgi:Xaa-Pro aminopeptidase
MTPCPQSIYPFLKEKNLGGLLVSKPANISYLLGFLSRDSLLLVSPKENVYFTDGRYAQEAVKYLKGKNITVKRIRGSIIETIKHKLDELGLSCIGFEERHISFGDYQNMKKVLGKGITLVTVGTPLEALREIKSSDEIKKIKEATHISVKAFKFIKKFLKPGKREIEIAAEMEYFIRHCGLRTSAFEIIVASGPNSRFPHHLTSQRRLKGNDLVLIDFGVDFQGYKSDLTRVFFLGKINVLAQKILGIVKEAKDRAINKIRPGKKLSEIDRVARNYIIDKGYGEYFLHSLGHGIGLEVHEAPTISAKQEGILKEGMVFTVEPAIYLPNKFGIRLEDMVLVTQKGCEVLNGTLH